MPKSNRGTLTSLAPWLSCRLSPSSSEAQIRPPRRLSLKGIAQVTHPANRPLTKGGKASVDVEHGILAHSRGRLRRLYRNVYLHGDSQLNLIGTLGQVCDRTESNMADEASR